MGAQLVQPFATDGRQGHDVDEGCSLAGLLHESCRVIDQIDLGQDHDRGRAAVPGQRRSAFYPAGVRPALDRLDDEHHVDVGGHGLYAIRLSRAAPYQGTCSRKDGSDDGGVGRPVQHHPISHGRGSGFSLQVEGAWDYCGRRSSGHLDGHRTTVDAHDASRCPFILLMYVEERFPSVAPTEIFELHCVSPVVPGLRKRTFSHLRVRRGTIGAVRGTGRFVLERPSGDSYSGRTLHTGGMVARILVLASFPP
jgi:hypothetical protein